MNIVTAIDSYKGSLTSEQAGQAARAGILRACPEADVQVCPIADGGEGTADALTAAMGGNSIELTVHGPREVLMPVARYGTAGVTAIMEAASACGLTLLSPKGRNPLHTTTLGLGEMISDALDRGCRRFIIGIGGSATNDGGIGMLTALGYRFLDRTGRPVSPDASGLKELDHIDTAGARPELKNCEFIIACDVDNPLRGPRGCSAVFGPQKGADQKMIQDMDRWLDRYASLVREIYPGADPDHPGAGAAGGLGFAFLSFLHGTLKRGIDIVMEETGLEDKIRVCDLVITGEGRLDSQSAAGKVPTGVAALAAKYHKPVIALAGSVEDDADACLSCGLDAYFPVIRKPCSLEQAMDSATAAANVAATAEQVMRIFMLGRPGV